MFSLFVHAIAFTAIIVFVFMMSSNKPKEKIMVDLTTVMIEKSLHVIEPQTPKQVQTVAKLTEPIVKKNILIIKKLGQKTNLLLKKKTANITPVNANDSADIVSDSMVEETATAADIADVAGDIGSKYSEIGIGERGKILRTSYINSNFLYIQKMIKKNLVYPSQAKIRGIRGKVFVKFTINEDGSVSNIIIKTTNGHTTLDEAGVNAVIASSPFLEPPISADIIVPIDFKLL